MDYIVSIKSSSHCRFMAEPDLAPLVLAGNDTSLASSDSHTEGSVDVDVLRRDLPELPMQTRLRLKTQYGNIFNVL